MATSYDVRFWEIRVRPGGKRPFQVRWAVTYREFNESLATKALAESRKAELIAAARRGEPFDLDTGLPLSELRARRHNITWYTHARAFLSQEWRGTPANTRQTLGDALATLTAALVKSERGRPDPRVLRRALYSHAFNKNRWDETPPEDWASALTWIERQSLPIPELENPAILRGALAALTLRLDGTPAAATTVKRKRAIFHKAVGMAAELGYFTLPINPLDAVRWTAPASAEAVDPAAVANPLQIRALLHAVRAQGARGRRLEAFFGCMYYAGMRPSEVIGLLKTNCQLPKRGWGRLMLRETRPQATIAWTDDGRAHQKKGLKARAKKDVRSVPIPPKLVALLRWHLYRYGTAADGRIFQTARGNPVQNTGYGEVWAQARNAALSPHQVDSPLVKRPYDIRHAGISLWLASRVPPAEVARRAGHSLAVLFRTYAKILAEGEEMANHLIDAAMNDWGHRDGDANQR